MENRNRVTFSCAYHIASPTTRNVCESRLQQYKIISCVLHNLVSLYARWTQFAVSVGQVGGSMMGKVRGVINFIARFPVQKVREYSEIRAQAPCVRVPCSHVNEMMVGNFKGAVEEDRLW